MIKRTRLALATLVTVAALSPAANAWGMPVAANTTESACDDGSQGAAPGDSLATGVVYAELFWRCRPEDLPAPPKPPGPGQVTTTLLSPTYLVPTRGGPVSKTRPVADAGLNLTNGGKGTVNVNGNIELYNYGSLWTGAPQFSMRPVVTYTVECLGSGKKIPVTANVQLSSDGKTATFGSTTNVPIGEACRVTGWHIVLTPTVAPGYIPATGAPSYTYDPKQPTGLVDVR